MKTISTLFFAGMLMSALCVAFVACNEPKETPQGVYVPFTEYSLGVPGEEFSARWVYLCNNMGYEEQGYVNKILMINSDEELKKQVEGDYPSIDFSKKTLVMVCGGKPTGFNALEYKFQQVSEQNYMLTINGKGMIVAATIEWVAAIVVDKLPSDSKIELKTILNFN